jgi:hypothetical protein
MEGAKGPSLGNAYQGKRYLFCLSPRGFQANATFEPFHWGRLRYLAIYSPNLRVPCSADRHISKTKQRGPATLELRRLLLLSSRSAATSCTYRRPFFGNCLQHIPFPNSYRPALHPLAPVNPITYPSETASVHCRTQKSGILGSLLLYPSSSIPGSRSRSRYRVVLLVYSSRDGTILPDSDNRGPVYGINVENGNKVGGSDKVLAETILLTHITQQTPKSNNGRNGPRH